MISSVEMPFSAPRTHYEKCAGRTALFLTSSAPQLLRGGSGMSLRLLASRY